MKELDGLRLAIGSGRLRGHACKVPEESVVPCEVTVACDILPDLICVASAAEKVAVECEGGTNAPSLGSVFVLLTALSSLKEASRAGGGR